MAYDSNEKRNESVYSQRVRAGKRRTYFFDVKETRGNDFYLTITESRKKFNEDGYDRHKIFLYKEDFNKFLKGITEAIDHVKTELMPDFDFDIFSHDQEEGQQTYTPQSSPTQQSAAPSSEVTPTSESDQKSSEAPETPDVPETTDSSESSADSSISDDTSHRDEHVDKW